MAFKTKQAVVDEIAYELYGGLPPNDRSISDNFILRKLNNRIAEAAVKSAFGANNLDSIVEADDAFRLTFTLTLTVDTNTGLKNTPMPANPVGLPSMRSFIVYPPANFGGRASALFKPIYASEVSRMRSQPKIRKVFYWEENGYLWFIDRFQIMASYNAVNMSLVTSGANNLTDILNLPDDMISGIKMLIIPELRQMLALQDTDPLPPQDAPEARV